MDRELPWKAIPDEFKPLYADALKKEWEAWQRFGAAQPCTYKEQQQVEKEMPERILTTRVCYRNKHCRQPNLPHAPKARLVVQGFKDPDLTDPSLRRDAPTLTRVGFMCLLHIQLYYNFIAMAGDATTAFMQGSPELFGKERSKPLYMKQPREGLPGLEAGRVLRLLRGVYGLLTAPRLSWLHLKETLLKMGFRQSSLDAALFTMHYPDGKYQAS